MIKRCFLYKATWRGSKARSGEKPCCEERERGWGRDPEWESGNGNRNGNRNGDRNRCCEREAGIADANGEIGIADVTGRSELPMQIGSGSGIGSKVVKREMGNGKREKGNGKRETGNGKRGNEETRKRGNEERSEAEGNTARDGDKAPNLTNE